MCQDGASDTESVIDTDLDSVSLSSVVTSSESTRLDPSSAVGQHVETAEPNVQMVRFDVGSTKVCFLLFMPSGGAVAQRVERWTCDQQVVGSNPTRGKSWASCSHLCASVTKQYNLVPAKGVMFCGWEGNRRPAVK